MFDFLDDDVKMMKLMSFIAFPWLAIGITPGGMIALQTNITALFLIFSMSYIPLAILYLLSEASYKEERLLKEAEDDFIASYIENPYPYIIKDSCKDTITLYP